MNKFCNVGTFIGCDGDDIAGVGTTLGRCRKRCCASRLMVLRVAIWSASCCNRQDFWRVLSSAIVQIGVNFLYISSSIFLSPLARSWQDQCCFESLICCCCRCIRKSKRRLHPGIVVRASAVLWRFVGIGRWMLDGGVGASAA